MTDETRLTPITTDAIGQQVETGFMLPTGSTSTEMGVPALAIYMLEGSDIVSIVGHQEWGHAFRDVDDVEGVIEALTRIRDARKALVAA